MLLKVKRTHRPLLEAMIGNADKSLMAGFVDDTDDDEAPHNTKVSSPTKAATIKTTGISVDEERKRAVSSALAVQRKASAGAVRSNFKTPVKKRPACKP